MLALATPLQSRLAALPALTGWAVRLDADTEDRRSLPAVTVGCIGAGATDSEAQAVALDVSYSVFLIAPRGLAAAAQLDAAFEAVVAALHNWTPGRIGARQWRRMALRAVRAPEFADT
ncbi:MAG: hypothetical protein ACTS8S_20240, partial [Giesbergeria sp.]